MSWYLAALKKYAQFSGRSQRMEYWMFLLFNNIVFAVLFGVEVLVGGPGILGMLYALGTIIPGLAVTICRLHDTNHSGWWILIGLVPCVGTIVLLIFYCTDSQPESNEWGPNPKVAYA